MSDAFAQWRQQVLATAHRLDDIDYFRLLGSSEQSISSTLKKRFSPAWQPAITPIDSETKIKSFITALEKIYRRITEAYAVLRDPH